MAATKRIRLVFQDDDILSDAQKFDGFNRSWLLLKPHQHDTVSDVASHLLHAFQLHDSCPNGLILSLSGYVLPPFESTHILKDDEIISLRKRRDILTIQGNHAANEVQKLKAAEKQPVNGDLLLLANEEFEKEKGGYESDEPEDDYEEVHEENLLEDVKNPSDSKKRKRKRKAEEKLQGSKKKKQRSEATQDLPNDAQREDTENSLENGEITKKKKKKRRSKEKTDDSSAEDNVENDGETAKLSENTPVPNVKGNVEVQENGKETEEGKSNPEGTKKGPSRSARRKYAKRRWLREMAKIQKQNATCESEGLRNWKEDKSKAEREKVDRQSIRPKKWNKHHEDAEKNVDDGQPKGLLHWKQSPQNDRPFKGKKRLQKYQNGYFQTHLNQNGDVEEQSNQKGDELEQTNQKQGDLHKQPGQQSAQENPNLNCGAALDQLNQEKDEETEVVPVVIRPGHIRFEPLGKEAEQAVQQNNVPSQTFQWNGITSKKKGQQWGKENRSFTPRNDYKNSHKENSEILSSENEKKQTEEIDFEKLPPLPSIPKEGDLIAYRVLELSSSWTPELSPYRVGKVSLYDAESGQTLLEPVPEYPIVSEKGGEDADSQPDNSLYKEDGSLEIDFSTLLDVRIVNKGSSEPGNQTLSCMTESSLGNGNASEAVVPGTNEKETAVSNSETGGASIWDQVSEALNAKKEQLSKDNGWGKTPTKVQPSQENSWDKNVKNVQPSQGSDWAEKVQPSQQNSWGKQNSGGKSWSYKALRGSALGPTMAILRSKKGWS